MNMNICYNNEKIPSTVIGLDRLLFGGIQLQTEPEPKSQIREPDKSESKHKTKIKPTTIVISGKTGTSKSMFAMQLLHGITKSLYKLSNKESNLNNLSLCPPLFCSGKSEENLSDMLLDYIISRCVNDIIEENIHNNKKWSDSKFSSTIFEVGPGCNILHIDGSKLDYYIGEEVVIYNNRTNGLHLTVAHRPHSIKSRNDDSNLIARRRYDNINSFCELPQIKDLKQFSDDFFEINIYNDLKKYLGDKEQEIEHNYLPCFVIDYTSKIKNKELIKKIQERSLATIFIVDSLTAKEVADAQLLIEMRSHEDNETGYLLHQICIHKSTLQNTALGWHQYKKRDYGIEIYPSTHLLLQRRRHMPKALLRGVSDILTDTFQQYIDKHCISENYSIAEEYASYNRQKEQRNWNRLKKIYHTLQENVHAGGILKKILIDESEPDNDDLSSKVTAIIGDSNSHKRFLCLGSTFSTSCMEQHTLNVLLDQEYYMMRKRMVCPSWGANSSFNNILCEGNDLANCKICRKCKIPNCYKCYKYIHFLDLRMGYITPDEFFHYLIRQINTFALMNNNTDNKLKKIIIDDIQKIDYSFPLIKRDKLFLTTLISICKDYEIDLFILCDKTSSFVNELRSLSDNVICTERKDNENRIYIERYSGYNAPSHIFGCSIKKINELFYCLIKDDDRKYYLDENKVESIYVPNMDHFWVSTDTNKIVNHLSDRKS